MPLKYLDDSPFPSYTVPGLILLFVADGSSQLAAIARWRHLRHGFMLTIAAGCLLLGWPFFESIWVPQGWMAQLLFAAAAAVMVAGDYQGWRQQAN